MNLSPDIRQNVILEEMAEGRQVWSDVPASINGEKVTVSACREWGAFLLGGRMIVLPHYPLQSLDIQIPVSDSAASSPVAQAEPITEQRKVTAKFRVTQRDSDTQMSFAPVQRVHGLETGELTELPDIHFKLDDKLMQDFGGMKVGDEKEFSMAVQVITGFRPPQPTSTGDA
jgi:hypothetical protein